MGLKINLECDISNGSAQACMCPIGMELTTFQKKCSTTKTYENFEANMSLKQDYQSTFISF
jgi:hypothetical protein